MKVEMKERVKEKIEKFQEVFNKKTLNVDDMIDLAKYDSNYDDSHILRVILTLFF